jgi:voltage-gated potassium channel
VNGDPTNKDTLLKAGIKKAESIIVMSQDDSKTILTVLAARSLSKEVRVIVKIEDCSNLEYIKDKIDSVINVSSIVSKMISLTAEDPILTNIYNGLLSKSDNNQEIHLSDIPRTELKEQTYRELINFVKKNHNCLPIGVCFGDKICLNPDLNMSLTGCTKMIVIGEESI